YHELLGAGVEPRWHGELDDRDGDGGDGAGDYEPAGQFHDCLGGDRDAKRHRDGDGPAQLRAACRDRRHDGEADGRGDGQQLHDAGADDDDQLLGPGLEPQRQCGFDDGDGDGGDGAGDYEPASELDDWVGVDGDVERDGDGNGA